MKIALVHPTSWPFVRRGTERFMNEFARYLGRQGHEVRIVTSTLEKPGTVRFPEFTVDYHRSLWRPELAKIGLLDFQVFPITAFYALLKERFDAVHCFNFTDCLAAAAVRAVRRTPVVLHVTSIPPSIRYRGSLHCGGALLGLAIRTADEVLTVSRAQQDYFRQRFGRECVNLPAPVDTDVFPIATGRDHSRPILLCASALDDRRKGGRLLMQAFDRVKDQVPAARLQISSYVSEALRSELLSLVRPQWQADVEFLGSGELSDLPGVYGRAAVLVLPSRWEAYPLVVLECLSTGTPAVGTNEGGTPELIADPAVGRTFEPGDDSQVEPTNLDGLVQAVLDTLELSRRPETALRCRGFAERFAWSTAGKLYERFYEQILARPRGRTT